MNQMKTTILGCVMWGCIVSSVIINTLHGYHLSRIESRLAEIDLERKHTYKTMWVK